jgi:epoxyqueuosine reductase
VCPVGGDYEPMHKDALDVIPEDTPEKQARLAVMVDDEKNGTRPPAFDAQRRWIGDPGGN